MQRWGAAYSDTQTQAGSRVGGQGQQTYSHGTLPSRGRPGAGSVLSHRSLRAAGEGGTGGRAGVLFAFQLTSGKGTRATATAAATAAAAAPSPAPARSALRNVLQVPILQISEDPGGCGHVLCLYLRMATMPRAPSGHPPFWSSTPPGEEGGVSPPLFLPTGHTVQRPAGEEEGALVIRDLVSLIVFPKGVSKSKTRTELPPPRQRWRHSNSGPREPQRIRKDQNMQEQKS